MGLLLSCCDDLNVQQKRKQFQKAIPELLMNIATEKPVRELAHFLAELIDAVKHANLEFNEQQSIRFVFGTVAVTIQKFEANPLIGAPIEEWLDFGPVTVAGQPKKKKKARKRPEEKLEEAWWDALEMVERKFLPDRRKTNLIANWILYDRDGSGDFSIFELRRLLHALNFDDVTVSFVMGKVVELRKTSLTYFEFGSIFDELLQFPELEDCWDTLSGWQEIEDDEFGGGMFDSKGNSRSASKLLLQVQQNSNSNKTKRNSVSIKSSSNRRKNNDNNEACSSSSSLTDDDEDDDENDDGDEKSGDGHGNKNAHKRHHTVTVEEFADFLVNTQKETAADAPTIAARIIDQIGGTMDKKAFMRYLTSPEINHIFDLEQSRQVYHDMNQPLCAYFINSSHNTYLTGNQLSSDSDANMYRRALREGCRSVEIDCWDGPFGRPIVYHGFTRTSKISFESVIEAINDSAFSNGNPFPVTISFELHVSIAQQNHMVDVMERIFGRKLARPTWKPGERAPHTISPNRYKNKILVKSARFYEDAEERERKAAEEAAHAAQKTNEAAEALLLKLKETAASAAKNKPKDGQPVAKSKEEEEEELWAKIKLPEPPKPVVASATRGGKTKNKKNKTKSIDDDDDDDESGSSDDEGDTAERRAYKKALQQIQDDPLHEVKVVKSKICKRLSDLVIVEACRIPQLSEDTVKRAQQYMITSFSENRSRKLLRTQLSLYLKLNRRQLTRIYPHAARFNSSNFHPQEHWNVGSQMCAMNWQTEDYKTRFAKSRFMIDNGNSGFLIKPHYLRFSAQPQPTATTPGVNLSVRVLSGFALPKPERSSSASEVIDPYVVMFCEGPFLPGEAKKFKTSVVDDNGFHPVWKGSGTETAAWHVPVPEMSTLVIQIWDEDVQNDDFIAEAYVPVDKIRSGCRCVLMQNEKLQSLGNTFVLAHVLAEDRRTGSAVDPSRSVSILQNTSTAASLPAAGAANDADDGDDDDDDDHKREEIKPVYEAKKTKGRTNLALLNLSNVPAFAEQEMAPVDGGIAGGAKVVLTPDVIPAAISPRNTAEWVDDTLQHRTTSSTKTKGKGSKIHIANNNHNNNHEMEGNASSPEARDPERTNEKNTSQKGKHSHKKTTPATTNHLGELSRALEDLLLAGGRSPQNQDDGSDVDDNDRKNVSDEQRQRRQRTVNGGDYQPAIIVRAGGGGNGDDFSQQPKSNASANDDDDDDNSNSNNNNNNQKKKTKKRSVVTSKITKVIQSVTAPATAATTKKNGELKSRQFPVQEQEEGFIDAAPLLSQSDMVAVSGIHEQQPQQETVVVTKRRQKQQRKEDLTEQVEAEGDEQSNVKKKKFVKREASPQPQKPTHEITRTSNIGDVFDAVESLYTHSRK